MQCTSLPAHDFVFLCLLISARLYRCISVIVSISVSISVSLFLLILYLCLRFPSPFRLSSSVLHYVLFQTPTIPVFVLV